MVSVEWRALGTGVVVAVEDPAALDRARAAVAAEVEALDLACSRFRDDSDLSRLNALAGLPVVVSRRLAEAIAAALRAARLTSGDVDPTVGNAVRAAGYDRDFDAVDRDAPEPGRRAPVPGWQVVSLRGEPPVVSMPAGTSLDLGATAKALGADRAARAAHDATGAGVLVSLGGDIAVAGQAPAGGWQVRIADDHAAPVAAGGPVVTLAGGGLATSGTAVRRWRRAGIPAHHIVDPRTGMPAVSPYRTVSVAAASCVDANTASTAAFVRGDGAREWLEATGLPARLVRHDGAVVHVNGWPAAAERAA